MPKVNFIVPAGDTVSVEVPAGHTLLEAAIDTNIDGIVAECGGACACATCHAYIDNAWVEKLPAANDMEDAMLDAADNRQPNSRLTWQVEVTDELDGLTLTVANNTL